VLRTTHFNEFIDEGLRHRPDSRDWLLAKGREVPGAVAADEVAYRWWTVRWLQAHQCRSSVGPEILTDHRTARAGVRETRATAKLLVVEQAWSARTTFGAAGAHLAPARGSE